MFLPQVLETVASKAKNSGINNIITSRVNVEKEKGSKLENESCRLGYFERYVISKQKQRYNYC
jgi:hypothetical protein